MRFVRKDVLELFHLQARGALLIEFERAAVHFGRFGIPEQFVLLIRKLRRFPKPVA
jgi:hypothetical protein